MDHESKTTHECETPVVQEGPVETQDRGLFDFLGKKKEGEGTKKEEVMAAEFEEKVKVEECKEEKEKEKKHGLSEKLHRSGSSSSSSSDEEEGEDEEKKKKRKEKKDKKKKEEEEKRHEDTTVPVEKCEDPGAAAEEKKGFLDKIKEKLPVGQKKADEVPSPPPAECPAAEPPCHDGSPHTESPKEKKGLLEKIKEKLPGYHPKSDEEKEKEKEKECR